MPLHQKVYSSCCYDKLRNRHAALIPDLAGKVFGPVDNSKPKRQTSRSRRATKHSIEEVDESDDSDGDSINKRAKVDYDEGITYQHSCHEIN